MSVVMRQDHHSLEEPVQVDVLRLSAYEVRAHHLGIGCSGHESKIDSRTRYLYKRGHLPQALDA